MNAFYDRQYDVLLSTSIVESGLDIPTANTLIVHRADMFGLAQLYQLRGPRRPLEDPRLCLFHHSRRCAADASRREAAESAAIARHAWRRLHAGEPRPRHQGRRQSARRGAIGPYPRGRLRALPVDAGRGRDGAEGRRGRSDRGSMVPSHQSRYLGADPGRLRA